MNIVLEVILRDQREPQVRQRRRDDGAAVPRAPDILDDIAIPISLPVVDVAVGRWQRGIISIVTVSVSVTVTMTIAIALIDKTRIMTHHGMRPLVSFGDADENLVVSVARGRGANEAIDDVEEGAEDLLAAGFAVAQGAEGDGCFAHAARRLRWDEICHRVVHAENVARLQLA